MNSELVEPTKYSLESIKRSRIAHKLIDLMNNRTSSGISLKPTKVRSIKRDINNSNNKNVVNKKAKVKLKRALLKHLKKTVSHKSLKKWWWELFIFNLQYCYQRFPVGGDTEPVKNCCWTTKQLFILVKVRLNFWYFFCSK